MGVTQYMKALWEKTETNNSLETFSMRVRPKPSNFAESQAYVVGQ